MLTNGIKEVEADIAAQSGGTGLGSIGKLVQRPDLLEFVAKSPILSQFLVQPDFAEILGKLKSDPNALGQHLNDQRVQMLLQELLRESNPDIFRKAEENELQKRKAKEAAEEAKKKQVCWLVLTLTRPFPKPLLAMERLSLQLGKEPEQSGKSRKGAGRGLAWSQ